MKLNPSRGLIVAPLGRPAAGSVLGGRWSGAAIRSPSVVSGTVKYSLHDFHTIKVWCHQEKEKVLSESSTRAESRRARERGIEKERQRERQTRRKRKRGR